MAKHIFISAIALAASAMAFSAPASAQLLGGSGGLGGNLGGTLGGTLANPTGPIGGTIGSTGELTGSGRGETHIDRRSGRVQGKGNAGANGKGSADGNGNLLGNPVRGNADGSGSASGNGSLDAQAVGTDYIGQTAHGAVSSSQGAASTLTGTARGAAGHVRDQAGGALPGVPGTASAAGSAAGSFQGSLGQLAAAGSGAASGTGMFAVEPGMAVTDARGKVIGHVQELRQTGRGVVQAVAVEVGNRVATLPAANFAGSGDVLVTGMTKGQLKESAEQQEGAGSASAARPAGEPAPQASQKRSRAERGHARND
ncbi:hypothetical protein FHR22_000311 [Sphingopyxis panaciterrae]|uniref:hypothetical protein n=1 Tax=Sphingopyxis panaciterrae TaxID=363841 RepID=UPI00141FE537|nr:hypothetical protein [Sphingopyxis panaciterrae]NIJ35662.1 hypothetical protein [Sphingopyxis panaciterrae]